MRNCFQWFLHITCKRNLTSVAYLTIWNPKTKTVRKKKGQDTDPHTRLANPTMIPDAKIAYPALRDSASYIFEDGTLSNFVCSMIATITPYIATASQKMTLKQLKSTRNASSLHSCWSWAWSSVRKKLKCKHNYSCLSIPKFNDLINMVQK